MRPAIAALLAILAFSRAELACAETSSLGNQSVTLDIASQPLGDALNQFAQQTGLQLIYHSRVAKGIQAPKVVGTLSPRVALSQLLKSTGLRFEYIDADTVGIFEEGQKAGMTGAAVEAPAAETVRVAQAEGAAAVGGDSSAEQPQSASGSAGDAEGAKLEEIVVTAQKRKERLQDVPFAITAIGQQEIQDRGSVDIKALQYSIPGLNIQELAVGGNRTTMRGITPGSGTALPIVGIYVDEVGISEDLQQRDYPFPLVDIERIEVLRGPQGTLYGQGSIAGTIRYITRNPDLAESEGFVEANAYSQDDGDVGYRVNGAMGVPLVTDRVGLRVSAGYDRLAGWIDYPAAGVEDANETERLFVRPKLHARLTDQLTLSLMYQYFEHKADTDAVSGVGSPAVRPGRTALYPAEDKAHLANAILSYDFGSATLLSSTGFQQRDLHFQTPFTPFLGDFPSRYEQFNQELRVSSNGEGPFRYTTGVWYRKFLSHTNRIFFDATGAPTAVARGLGDDPVDSESAAVFGDGTYSMSDRLDLSLGARYYLDERTTSVILPAPPSRREADFHSVSPRASMRFAWTPDASSYVTVSKGFRSGGFNLPNPAHPAGTQFEPETLWNYEIGTKANLLGGALFVDVAGYWLDYSDRQTQSVVPAGAVSFTEVTNAGKASGFGVEGSISARLAAGLRLEATAAYNDIRSDTNTLEVKKGERFGSVADFTGSIALSQRRALNERLEGMWRIDFQHSDPFAYISRSATTGLDTQNFHTDPQDYLNLRVGVETRGVGVYLDAQNILDEDSVLFPFFPIIATQEGTRARPRSYGVTLRWNFE